jgi:LysM repeat protein
MDESMHEEMKGLIKGFAEDQGYSRTGKGGDLWRTARSFDFKSHKKPLLIGCMGIFVFIFIFGLLSRDKSGAYKENQNPIQATSDQIELKLSQLQGLEEKIAHLEREGKKIRQAIREAESSKRALAKEIEKLGKRPHALNTQKSALRSTNSTYHAVRSGDSLYEIAQQYALSVGELCRLNNLARDQVIHPGQRLLISPSSHP